MACCPVLTASPALRARRPTPRKRNSCAASSLPLKSRSLNSRLKFKDFIDSCANEVICMPRIILTAEPEYLRLRAEIHKLKCKLEALSKSEALHKRGHVRVMAWLKASAP